MAWESVAKEDGEEEQEREEDRDGEEGGRRGEEVTSAGARRLPKWLRLAGGGEGRMTVATAGSSPAVAGEERQIGRAHV